MSPNDIADVTFGLVFTIVIIILIVRIRKDK